MEDILIYMTIASSLLVIIFIISLLRSKSDAKQDEVDEAPVRRPGAMGAPVRRVAGRVVRSRLQRQRVQQQERDDDEHNVMDLADENDSEGEADSGELSVPTDVKIGTKKRKKLEMKAERRMQREQEMEEREERKRRQALLDEERKQQEEQERLDELKRKEEEQRLLEEKKRREQEEYLKLKESFQVESEGFDEDANETEGKDMLKEFIDYIMGVKVVFLEDLAVRFKLKTQDVIERVNSLLESGDLTGVIDDRGKFIYISQEELNAVARFIKQRGRVSISELVESSNLLINMNSAKST